MNATVAPVALRAFSMPGAMSAKPEVPASYWNVILYFCLGFRASWRMMQYLYVNTHAYLCIYIYAHIYIRLWLIGLHWEVEV